MSTMTFDSHVNFVHLGAIIIWLILCTSIGISLPYAFSSVFLPYGNAFAGGVILVTGLVHLLGDAISLCLVVGWDLRIANALCVGGVCVPFLLEKGGLVLWILQHPKLRSSKSIQESESVDETTRLTESQIESQDSYLTIKTRKDENNHGFVHMTIPRKYCSIGPKNTTCVVPSITSVKLQNRVDILRPLFTEDHQDDLILHADMIFNDECAAESKLHNHLTFASNMLLLVLTIHSTITGVALGAVFDSASFLRVAPLIAFSLHKFFESLALGTTFFKQEHPKLRKFDWFKILVYVLATPIGVAFGGFLVFGTMSQIVLLSITSGTFVYIALVEIIGEEFQAEESRVTKFLCFVLGILTAGSVSWWAEKAGM